MKKYGTHILKKIDRIINTQEDNIKSAGNSIYNSLKENNNFLIVGSGHSHMIAEEIYARAGGYANVKAILEPELMLHEHPLKSTLVERLSGYADIILTTYSVKMGDSIVIVSNSGRNVLPVELAIGAKKLGANVIAITNIEHSSNVTSRHVSGKKLMDISDIVIDNCGDFGDASFKIGEFETLVGASSTITGAFIAQAIVNEIIKLEVAENGSAPVFRSSNIEGSDVHNKNLMQKYKML